MLVIHTILTTSPVREAVLESTSHRQETELRTGDEAHLVAGLAFSKLWVDFSVARNDGV